MSVCLVGVGLHWWMQKIVFGACIGPHVLPSWGSWWDYQPRKALWSFNFYNHAIHYLNKSWCTSASDSFRTAHMATSESSSFNCNQGLRNQSILTTFSTKVYVYRKTQEVRMPRFQFTKTSFKFQPNDIIIVCVVDQNNRFFMLKTETCLYSRDLFEIEITNQAM